MNGRQYLRSAICACWVIRLVAPQPFRDGQPPHRAGLSLMLSWEGKARSVPGPQGAPARAQSVRARAQEVHRSFLTIPPPSLPRRPLVLLITLSPATTACPPCVTFTC